MVNVVPVDVAEEGVRHDLLGISRTGSETQFRLAGQQLLQNGNRVARHVNGVKRLICKNGIVDFILVLTTEGRLLQKHLVDEDTERPPINRAAILLIKQNLKSVSKLGSSVELSASMTYLWCHKFGSTTECASRRAIPHVLLAETVIGNLDVTVESQENVVQLQITVNDTVLVEILQSQANLSSIKPGGSVSTQIYKITKPGKLTEPSSTQTDHAEYAASGHHH